MAGYYGADDNHTHYRYVQTVVTAAPTLNQLNGQTATTLGGVGVELCDPNIGISAQLALADINGTFQAFYLVGAFTAAADPCVSNGLINAIVFRQGTPLGLNAISPGDQLSLAIYYTPGGLTYTSCPSASATSPRACAARLTAPAVSA
jgi:hypothetical protein